MAAIIVLVIVLAALGAATIAGWTADSRDPDYGLGRVTGPAAHPLGR